MTYEYEGKTEKEAIEKAAAELGLERDQFDVEILETQKNSLFKKGYVKIRVHTVDSADASSDDGGFSMSKPQGSAVTDPLPQDEFEKKGVNITQRLHKTDYHNLEFTIEDVDGRWICFGIKEA